MTDDQIREYLGSLKPGDQVIETSNSCMAGKRGVVYIGDGDLGRPGVICVMWENKLGTSVTWGTRRVADVCSHKFQPFFGPVLKCSNCGSMTTYSMDGQPKMVLPPANLS